MSTKNELLRRAADLLRKGGAPGVYIDSFIREIEAELEETEWRDIEKERPENNTYVLVACEGGNVDTSFFCMDASFFDKAHGNFLSRKNHGKWSKHFELARKYGYKVTHWMPRPTHPGDKK